MFFQDELFRIYSIEPLLYYNEGISEKYVTQDSRMKGPLSFINGQWSLNVAQDSVIVTFRCPIFFRV